MRLEKSAQLIDSGLCGSPSTEVRNAPCWQFPGTLFSGKPRAARTGEANHSEKALMLLACRVALASTPGRTLASAVQKPAELVGVCTRESSAVVPSLLPNPPTTPVATNPDSEVSP